MYVNGQLYCNYCCLLIDKQKHASFKLPGSTGEDPSHYEHYHNRDSGDCYRREIKRRDVPSPMVPAQQAA